MKFTTILVLSTLLVCIGCRSLTSPARSHSLKGGVTWIDYDATRRGALVIPKDGGQMMVSEPSPDVALGVVADFIAKASYSNITGEASAKVTETIAELGKRTQTVMVLRECLFRINELQLIKKDLTKEEIKELYIRVMETVLELAQTDKEAATATKLSELNELIRAIGKDEAKTLLEKLDKG